MTDNMLTVIENFLHERKTEKLKPKSVEEKFERKLNELKKKQPGGVVTEEDSAKLKTELRVEIDKEFNLDNWLRDAANRATQLSIVTHPSKYTHPSAKTSPVYVRGQRTQDGFVKTGNVDSDLEDVYGNAAALDVYKFLSLRFEDGRRLIDHIEQDNEIIKKLLSIEASDCYKIREDCLAIKKSNTSKLFTSDKIKQVYFPCDKNYHLLSILTPSVLVFELKRRLDIMRFDDLKKTAKDLEKKGHYSDTGYDDIYDLSVIGYGGSKPQNISVLNSKNGGKAYLLRSLPPVLQKRAINFPSSNFFKNNLRLYQFRESFNALHKLLVVDYNNKNIRDGRDSVIAFIIDRVNDIVLLIRQQKQNSGWSVTDYYSGLPEHQKIWLDDYHKDKRNESDEWLYEVVGEFSRWIISSYKKLLGKQAVSLGDEELHHIKGLIEENMGVMR